MFRVLVLICTYYSLVALLGCQEKKSPVAQTHFTKEDSLTDRYLVLQDSMLQAWNLMMNDDNQKIKTMQFLLHELSVGKQISEEKIETLEHRLAQLLRIRYTQRTMANLDVVEEYDFASNSLVSELLASATAAPNFHQNPTLQELAERISIADQRVYTFRADYDEVATRYNGFLEQNKTLIKSIDESCSLDKKPLFDMLAEE
jgi:hypothetical protein